MSKDIFEVIKDKSVEEALYIYLKGNAGTSKKIALRQLLEELVEEIMKGNAVNTVRHIYCHTKSDKVTRHNKAGKG